MKPSDEIIARYLKIERETDVFGRCIGVKKLKPDQRLKIVGMTPDLEGINQSLSVPMKDDETGEVSVKEVSIPYRAQALFAAAVVEIDGTPITFPKNRAELDAIMNALDEEGMTAASIALGRLHSDEPADQVSAAKNSVGTPTSDNASGL